MSEGSVRIDLPRAALTAAVWHVDVGGATGQAGDIIPAPPGNCLIVVEADIRLPGARVASRLRVTVPVTLGHTTRVRIHLPDLPLQKSVTTLPNLSRTFIGKSMTSNEAAWDTLVRPTRAVERADTALSHGPAAHRQQR